MSVAIPYTDWSIFPLYFPGVSAESRMLQNLVGEAFKKVKDNVTNEKRLVEAIATLEEIYKECNKPNWDGYGAKPLDKAAYNEALKLLDMIPPSFPMPEIVPEPDGGIGLEWSTGRRSIFTISLNGRSTLNYAGLFGVDKTYGTAHFMDSLPPTIVDIIRRLYP